MPDHQNVRSDLTIYSPTLQRLADIDVYISFTLNRVWYGVGVFELHIATSAIDGTLLGDDNVIIAQGNPEKSGFIVTKKVETDDRGVEKWVVSGYTLNGITKRRITFPTDATKSTHSVRNISAEGAIIEFCRRNMTSKAEPHRVIPFVSTANSQGRGGKIVYSTRYQNLDEECTEIAKSRGLGWSFIPDFELGKWVIRFGTGTDRTRSSANPVIFSDEFDNVGSWEYVYSRDNYKNVAIVAGEGTGKDRVVIEAGDTGAVGAKRYEVFVDARDLQTDTEESQPPIEDLITRGEQKLASEYAIEETFSGEVYDVEDMRFGINYFLGDLVTRENKRIGVSVDTRITQVTETWEATGYVVEPTFGDDVPSLADKIKRIRSELKGVTRT